MKDDNQCLWKYIVEKRGKDVLLHYVSEDNPAVKELKIYRCMFKCDGYGKYRENNELKECQEYYPIKELLRSYWR